MRLDLPSGRTCSINARHDYEVNLRTQLEILRLAHRVEKLAQAAHAERKDAAEASPKD